MKDGTLMNDAQQQKPSSLNNSQDYKSVGLLMLVILVRLI
jgi:hypothetical protein